MWVTNGTTADLFVLFAKVTNHPDYGKKSHGGVTCFIIEKNFETFNDWIKEYYDAAEYLKPFLLKKENMIQDLHEYESANIICGRYEGFDQRIIEMHSDYEIAIGQTVVSGGEIPAMFLIEALVRKIPGILGNSESLTNESFTNNKSDFPVYTRPEIYENLNVPEVLLSGDHKRIEEWKKNNLKDI